MGVLEACGLGSRTVLLPMELSDCADIQRLGADEVFRLLPDISTPFDAQAWVAGALSNPENYVRHVIRLRHGFDAVGYVQISLRWNMELQLGYWLGQEWWGQGLATEAAASAMCLLFEAAQRPLRMYAAALPTNLGSTKVLAKLGFKPCASDTNARVTPGMQDHVWGAGLPGLRP